MAGWLRYLWKLDCKQPREGITLLVSCNREPNTPNTPQSVGVVCWVCLEAPWCCTAAYKHGMPIKKIKELRRWHKEQSAIWQDGYDTYGNWIANNLVKGSPFWSRVTEAGHTAFVERRVTPMSCLAVLVIAPGSWAVGIYKHLRRKVNAYAL